jgi:predicted Zn-dependent peptidase
LYVLNTALGGGMTSRLFQKIREDAGLAYAIYSDIDVCLDSGLFCISAGSDPTDIPRVLKMIINECKSIVSDSISHQELKDSKSQLIGSMYLSLEGSNNVMNRLARMAMYDDQYIPIEETVSKIDQVTSSDIQSLAEVIFCPENLHLTAVGPISQDALSL